MNAPPSTGDVEMQEIVLPLAPPLPPINEQLLGGEAAEALPVADGALTKSGEVFTEGGGVTCPRARP